MALAITRDEHSAAALRREARRTHDSDQARRLLALALVLEGQTRTAAGRAADMDRQRLRDCSPRCRASAAGVIRYNAEGVDGLRDQPRPGRSAQLSKEQMAVLTRLVKDGPDIAVDKVVRWRCVDLQAQIKARFGVEISERHVGRLLKQLRFTRLSVRPRHPEADEAAQQRFKKTSPPW